MEKGSCILARYLPIVPTPQELQWKFKPAQSLTKSERYEWKSKTAQSETKC